MDVKDLIDSIIRDLTEDAPISRIMLKAQAISSFLGNKDFAAWVKNEQSGYGKGSELPEYRKCGCSAKVNLTKGFEHITNLDVPIDAIPDKQTRKLLSTMYFSEPISEIERLSLTDKTEGMLRMVAPVYAYAKVNEIFPYSNVDMLWMIANVSAASGVVDKVKSKMLDFFLELEKKQKLGIDFNKLEGRNEVAHIVNQTINAGIYNADRGVVNVSNSTVGNNVSVTNFDKDTLSEYIKLIRECNDLKGNADAEEELAVIDNEIRSENSSSKVIKRSLLFLKDISVNIGASVAAEYIIKALELL